MSARFNRFTRDINPYLLEPKGDKGIVRWMLDEMPASCFNAVDAVERLAEEENAADLLSKGTFDAAQYRGLRAKVMPSTACAGDDAVRGVDKAQRSRSAPPRTERRVSVGGVCDVAVLPPVSAAERERTRREMREALAATRAEVGALGGRHLAQ